MTSRDFAYWLQGFFELTGKEAPVTTEQVECIKRHLQLVFKHEIDPSMGPADKQLALDAIHHPKTVYRC
jgi:hypothetical protein